MAGYIDTVEVLNETPWRWQNAGRNDLGEAIMTIRTKLEAREAIDLSSFPAIENVICDESDLRDWQSLYGKKIKELSRATNLLLIHPRSDSPNFRLTVTKAYLNAFYMLEAIDDSGFYTLARQLDTATPGNYVDVVEQVMRQVVNRSELPNWISKGGLVKKKVEKLAPWQRERYENLLLASSEYVAKPSVESLRLFVFSVRRLPQIMCYRGEFYTSILQAMSEAYHEGTTIEEAMIINRNRIRRLGRRLVGRCIGTTLLTKGLEFDTVGILNAQTFTCPKHFYVAISRASRRLVIFSNSRILNPYSD